MFLEKEKELAKVLREQMCLRNSAELSDEEKETTENKKPSSDTEYMNSILDRISQLCYRQFKCELRNDVLP